MFFKTWAKCGHKTKKKDKIHAFGETVTMKLCKDNGKIPYCHRCLEKMTIRCVWCGKPIFIGDPITLCSPKPSFKIPSWAVVYSKKPLRLVGCLRYQCADTGAARAGFWDTPGKVYPL